jgi:DNA primase
MKQVLREVVPLDGVTLVKENIQLSTVVSRYTELKRKGNKLSGCCPFHNEKTPSFYVDDQKGLYHCFGCKAGGDILQFVQSIENMPFLEALDFLAEMAGVELPKRGKRGPSRDLIEALREINEAAATFFSENLKRQGEAKDYLKRRGLTDSTVALFRLGYAPEAWDGLYNHLRSRFDPKILMQSGLFKEGKRGNPYDLFRKRVMFPIIDTYGHIVAFGGRAMDDDGPKYINSPESPLYVKGKHCYNLNFAKAYLKRHPQVVITEGYMDVIQVYQAGMGAVIAGLGTAFTDMQAKLVMRYAEKVVLNFDGDNAGFKAARTSIETFLKRGADLRVVALPNKQDPDDYIREHGLEAYREQIDGANDFFDFLFQYYSQDRDLSQDPHGRSEVVREIGGTLLCLEDAVVRDFYVSKLADQLGIAPGVITQVMHQIKAEKPQPRQPKQQTHQVQQPNQHGRQRQQGPPMPPPDSSYGPPPPFDPGPDPDMMPDYDSYPEPFVAPAPEPVRVIPFTLMERQFLYHVLHQRDFHQALNNEQRQALPRVLTNYFADRSWVLEFVMDDHETDINEILSHVPREYVESVREIYFSEGIDCPDKRQLPLLFNDILMQMIEKLVANNQQRLREIPASDSTRISALLRQNYQLKIELNRLRS